MKRLFTFNFWPSCQLFLFSFFLFPLQSIKEIPASGRTVLFISRSLGGTQLLLRIPENEEFSICCPEGRHLTQQCGWSLIKGPLDPPFISSKKSWDDFSPLFKLVSESRVSYRVG